MTFVGRASVQVGVGAGIRANALEVGSPPGRISPSGRQQGATSMVKRLGSVVATLFLVGTTLSMKAQAADVLGVSPGCGPGGQSTFKVSCPGMSAGTAQITVGAETNQWGAQVWPIVTLANTESL